MQPIDHETTCVIASGWYATADSIITCLTPGYWEYRMEGNQPVKVPLQEAGSIASGIRLGYIKLIPATSTTTP